MNFETLDANQTTIWISNIEKTIAFSEILEKMMNERLSQMDDEYTAKYCNGWRKFFYDKDYWISASGNAYTGFCKARYVKPLSNAENDLRYFVELYIKKRKVEDKEVHERWSKYAKQPFEVHESDIIFYQKMKCFHKKAQKIAHNLGMEYEAFNLDEDC